MQKGKPDQESRTEVEGRARIRKSVGSKGYKYHAYDKNISNRNKQHR